MPSLSVIIPAHRRPEILGTCLEHVARQTIADQLEVIVVSDAPLEHSVPAPNVRLEIVPPCHQGAARNHGIALATAPRVLFIGDDIFLAPDACALHAGAAPGVALLGFTTWDPACGITPVMRWLEATGWQFGYPFLAPYAHKAVPREMQHRFTYTSHVSIPTEVARAHPFREDLTLYGWEDVVWGTDLAEAGVPLIYAPDARALHHHHLSLADSRKRMETLGASAAAMAKVDPRFDRIPKGWNRLAYEITALLPTLRGTHAAAFLRGLNSC